MNPRYPVVASRAAHRCEYCHAPEQIFNFPFEVEHIIPLYRNGADAESNWALSCRSCNLHKGIRVVGKDPESKEIRLFHPRQDKWDEHFQVDVESGAIAGTTTMGRATVVCLEFNSPTQIMARQLWIRLGLFP